MIQPVNQDHLQINRAPCTFPIEIPSYREHQHMAHVECKRTQDVSRQTIAPDSEIDYLLDKMVLKLRTTYYELCGIRLH
jgi:hypothetical protein